MTKKPITGLYAVIDLSVVAPYSAALAASELFRAGVKLVQVRAKDLCASAVLKACAGVREAAAGRDALFIVNDRVDVALECGADGVHLGQDDLPVQKARALLGPATVIGLSTHNEREAAEASKLGADYISFGPVFATKTKKDAQPPKGLAMLKAAKAVSRVPVVAIGGIDETNVKDVLASGADSVAMISALFSGGDIEGGVYDQARRIVEILEAIKQEPSQPSTQGAQKRSS